MSFNKFASRAAIVGGLLVSASAMAVPLNTSGVWSALDAPDDIQNVAGVGTSNVSWGNPAVAGDENSSFGFAGIEGGDAPITGDLFPLGDFTHGNNPIFLPGISGATLQTSLDFTSATFSPTFDVMLDETLNEEPCNPAPTAGNDPCPDIISIPDATSDEIITIGGINYLLDIVGFSIDGGASVLDEFVTQESQPNTATLFARLIEQAPPPGPVPVAEPNLTGLAAFALLGIGMLRTRRRNG